MRLKGSAGVSIKCKVKIPGDQSSSYSRSVMNFKREWAEIMVTKGKKDYLEAEVIDMSSGCGIVKFYNGVLISIPVEYICLLE